MQKKQIRDGSLIKKDAIIASVCLVCFCCFDWWRLSGGECAFRLKLSVFGEEFKKVENEWV